MKKENINLQAQVVNGECPTCQEITVLVGLTHEFYRCMNCGADLAQQVNGKISYLPIMQSRKDGSIPYVKGWK
jgi:ribosomal protein S27E